MNAVAEKQGNAPRSRARKPVAKLINRELSLVPDDAQRFLDLLAPGEPITFQTFDDDAERKKKREAEARAAGRKPRDPFAKVRHGTLAEHRAELAGLNEQDAGIFLMVNAGDGKGRSARNVQRVRALYVDLDGAPLEPVKAAPLAPHAIVESSPGRWHAYWLIADCELEQFTPMQKALIQRFGSDECVHDLPRVMRLPGFQHRKGEPFQSHIIETHDAPPYTLAQFCEAFGFSAQSVQPGTRSRSAGAAPVVKVGDKAAARKEAEKYIEQAKKDPAIEGAGGRNRTIVVIQGVLDYITDPDEVLELLGPFNDASEPRWDADELEELVRSLIDSGSRETPLGSRTKEGAQEAARKAFDAVPLAMFTGMGPAAQVDDPDDDYSKGGTVSPTSDLANAHRIARRMHKAIRFVPGIGWHVWTGARWKADALEARSITHSQLSHVIMKEVERLARGAARLSDHGDDDGAKRRQGKVERLARHAGDMENVAKIEAAMKAAEPLLRVDASKLDADPMLLGCENGVLDLRTGNLLAPDPDQLITRSTGIAYDPAAKCPTWEKFLARIFRGQQADVVPFIQRMCGYWLTGLTDPPMLAVLLGGGNNGKSTFLAAMEHVLGEYACTGQPSLLLKYRDDSRATDFALLQGRRLVAVTESQEGAKLNEAAVKSITGSDTIAARRLYQMGFNFTPTHKLVLQTNHRPIVEGTDMGIWRRIKLIPFAERIGKAECDRRLGDKLRAEAPGILRWALEGCLSFQMLDGLHPPTAVTEATSTYRSDSDVLASFLVDECDVDKNATSTTGELFKRYTDWAHAANERPMTKTMFGQRLQERGFLKCKKAGVRAWGGIQLKAGS